MVRTRGRGAWGVAVVLVAAGLLWASPGGVTAQETSPGARASLAAPSAAAEPLPWTVDRQRFGDADRWLDVVDLAGGVLAVGRDAAGPTVIERRATGSWTTRPFPVGGDGAASDRTSRRTSRSG